MSATIPALPETMTLVPDNVREQLTRVQIDRSCRQTVIWYYASALFWLLFGSLFAMLASVKMHNPEFLSQFQWLTFGRVRPVADERGDVTAHELSLHRCLQGGTQDREDLLERRRRECGFLRQ